MPIYEFKCADCGKVFEELVSDNNIKHLPCPACKSKKTEKLMSVFGALTKGSTEPACAKAGCPGASRCMAGGGCPSMGM